MYKNLNILFLVFLIFSCQPQTIHDIPNRKGVVTSRAMVVSAHPLASGIGKEILLAGGNAIDAAVAVHFALAVVYPAAGNIGGGGFLVYREADGACHTLDYRERAPAAAARNMYLDDAGEVDTQKSIYGHLAAGVPGSVDGMVTIHERFGTLPWETLLQPAILLAKNGFLLTQKEADGLNNNQEHLLKYNTVTPGFLMKNQWNAGDTIFYHDLANTLERISAGRRAGFYEGETARLIVEEMQRGGGLITFADLENYRSVWRYPVIFEYKDHRIISMGPPSSGGVAINQLLTMVGSFPLSKWGPNHEKTIHLMTEVEKVVYADRAQYLGDPDFTDIPMAALTDVKYLRKRVSGIDFKNTRPSEQVFSGKFESEETTHFSIVDQFGNAVSSTTTLNGGYGNKVIVAGAGFFLNNEMDDFSTKPGVPNMYGLVGGEVNAIAPDKRMLSSMTPTIIEKNGQLFMVVGTPGGSTIITSVFQVILNVIEFNMNMQGAVDFPRFHHQWQPDYIQYESGRFDDNLLVKLTGKGHELRERSSYGRVDAILVIEDGKLEGGADPRGDDAADGF